MDREKISVIVPVYNVEDYLPRCVDSILTQTYQNLEIILVDDGATDGSGQICDEYAGKDPRIKVIQGKRRLEQRQKCRYRCSFRNVFCFR